VQEIVTENNPEVLSQLNRMAAADAPMETVAFWLKGNKTPFSSGSSSRSAEQIPMELLPRMHALQDGQDAIFPSSTSITILRLVSSQKAPIAELAGRPRIAQYLNTQHVSIAITEHMKELRNKTTVVYAGEFAHPLSVLEVKPTAAPVAATVAAHAESTNAVRSTLEKGVAGLK
jgi:hypothetical protein